MRKFIHKFWYLLFLPVVGFFTGFCLIDFIYSPILIKGLCFSGWILSGILLYIISRLYIKIKIEVLKGKIEVLNSHKELIDKVNKSIEYFSGYDEELIDSIAIYSEMAKNGVEAPIANSIVSFADEVGPNHTTLLVGVDHVKSRYHFRVAGRAIYLTQLKAVWELVNIHLEKNAKPYGTIVIQKDLNIIN